MTKAIRFHQQGGPDVLQWEEVEVGDPGPGEVRIRHQAVGLNFVDVYQRSGMYPMPVPSSIGTEGAGVIEAVGSGVTALQAGDRAAYAGGPLGAYSEARVMPAARVLKLPEGISFDTAAAMMLKGLTSQYLLRQIYKVGPGDTIVFHAAAGGVGLIACQWAKSLGATVIGTVGSDEKASLARAHGCEHAIVYTRDNFVERVKEITGGAGVPVVYDSVGKDTVLQSVECLRRRGILVNFGNASGPVPPFDLRMLAKGSLSLIRPAMIDFTFTRAELEAATAELFAIVESGKVKIAVKHRYPLKDAARAHADLAARKTTGSVVLLP
ncbi:MAG: quinone oxidoreductase [Betaproteobacteria bacterium]|nr:quinone oxidoreductase [Betaproteobacteria bacterium]